MKNSKKINTKLILVSAFFAALVFPFVAGAVTSSSSAQNATITVAKAIEVANPSGDIAFGSVAPGAGGTTTLAKTSLTNITGGQRSNATYAVNSKLASATGAFTTPLQIADSCAGSFSNLTTGANTSVKTGQARNTNNALQAAVQACFQQAVSWADAGTDSSATISTVETSVGNN